MRDGGDGLSRPLFGVGKTMSCRASVIIVYVAIACSTLGCQQKRIENSVLVGSYQLPPASADDVDARNDIARGHLAIHMHGLPRPWVATYANLLKDRLGVHFECYG